MFLYLIIKLIISARTLHAKLEAADYWCQQAYANILINCGPQQQVGSAYWLGYKV